MTNELECIAVEHNDRLKIIPIGHLKELSGILKKFEEEEALNSFQKWIIKDLYQFETPEAGFKINSIILAAIHHPFLARVGFTLEGREKTFQCLVRSDFNKAEEYLWRYALENGYSIIKADNLPLKRLGVHSGLAKYGRNNITYVDGLGSNFSYAAYFSDITCGKDTWGSAEIAEICGKCSLCVKSCPTGAILKDRFLIDNQKCLSCVNESPGEFPDWLPAAVHHTLYDCLVCQNICPLNRLEKDKIIEGLSFSEDETGMLLAGMPIESFSVASREKIYLLGLDEWYEAIPRNLKTLFQQG